MTTNSHTQEPNHDRELLSHVASRYDRCHRDDSFSDLAGRAPFSKEDRRLMEDWLDAGRRDFSRS